MFRLIYALVIVLTLSGCSTQYANRSPLNEPFPTVKGNTLEETPINLPLDLESPQTLLLIGYRQNAQFDIDRWLIGLNMTNTNVPVFEVPAIQGWIPSLLSNRIDGGMRNGIPRELWSIVITVYEDGETIQAFTGNERPNNARVVLLDDKGKVIHFYDKGFSVQALNDLRSNISDKPSVTSIETQTE